jgi:hypothetical protein
MKQESNDTMQQFIRKIDLLAARLGEKGLQKTQDEKLYKLINGMGTHWDTQRGALEITANIQSYKDVCALLLGIAVARGEVSGDMATGGEAHFTIGGRGRPKHGGKVGGKVGNGGYKGRSTPSQSFPGNGGTSTGPKVFCMACNSTDHHTANCTIVPNLTIDPSTGKYPLICFHCHKPGHVSRECPSK